MKCILSAALALLAATVPAAAAERRYSVTDFDRVQVDGPYKVSVATGRSPGAVATGSAEAIEQVAVEVQGSTLHIRRNRSAWGGYPGEAAGPATIVLTGHDLSAAMVNGSGNLTVDRARGGRIDISLSGSGRVALGSVEADILVVSLLGSGRIEIGGNVKQLKATIQGSGDFDARALTAEDAVVNADTAGNIAVGAARTAKVAASGQGEVEIIGSPACTVSGLGAALVKCGP